MVNGSASGGWTDLFNWRMASIAFREGRDKKKLILGFKVDFSPSYEMTVFF